MRRGGGRGVLIEREGRRPDVDPSAWVAPPDRHEDIWAIQEPLDFPATAVGLPRDAPDLATQATRRYAEMFGRHRADRVPRED